MRPGCHWCTQWQLGSLTRPRDRLQRTVEAHHAGLMGHGDRSMGQVHHWHGPRSPPRHCQGGPGATTSAGPQAAVTSESGLRGGRSVGGSAGRLGSCRCDRRGLFSDTGPIVALLGTLLARYAHRSRPCESARAMEPKPPSVDAGRTPADETGVGSSSSLARNRRLPLRSRSSGPTHRRVGGRRGAHAIGEGRTGDSDCRDCCCRTSYRVSRT
jgi:hypothetical protein